MNELELEKDLLKDTVKNTLKNIYDPEIPVNIYDLGLIYAITVNEEGFVNVVMTLTTPNCPEAETIPVEVEQAIMAIPQVSGCRVDLVWEPPWDRERMSEAARLELGMFY